MGMYNFMFQKFSWKFVTCMPEGKVYVFQLNDHSLALWIDFCTHSLIDVH